MRADAFLRFSKSALVAGALLVAGCTGGGGPDIAAIKPTGVTDQPARGYEQIAAGSEEELVMNAGRRVYFSSGSAELDDVARETLDLQAQFLNSNPKWLVKLQGFADDPGNNNALSDKRAKAVMAYLASKGVDPQRMWAQGYGKERLVRDCPDISCKALNRRVVTNLRTEFDEAAPQFKNGKV